MIKKILSSTMLIMGFLLTGCDKDRSKENEPLMVDYAPVDFYVQVLNKNGNNLLNPETEENIREKEMTITINGITEEVALQKTSTYPYTRAIMPYWYGAYITSPSTDIYHNDYFIRIGEFSGDANGEKVILSLDGTSHTLSFTNKIIEQLNIERHFYIDGKENNTAIFKIIL